MREISQEELKEVLEKHAAWLRDEEGGERANLSSANLSWANLRSANLRSADLRSADLRWADLRSADLSSANLSSANLRSADLRSADLSSADLRWADLRSADLSSADLRWAKNTKYAFAATSIIPDGDIVGWKNASGGIVKLLIPADAKRSNATGRKCRAEFAKVLELQNLDGTPYDGDFLRSNYESNFEYRVGEIVKPTKPYDKNRWNECSTGIHFFITRDEAEEW